ncbi:MAG: DNA topoisomerase (ATP-hydrolyzing) subunit B [Christensenellaceae bacterium]|nr:DNA topoisomerase (ATP-hydrolyzing) subunit B [Christensenellaceae bacterium]
MQNNSSYDESQIQVLEGLEPVRKRPGMYIGSTDKRGLHHLVYEIVDNSIDEAMAGFCNKIDVVIYKDGSISVTDNGRGIPTGTHPKVGKSSLEVALTMLHAGGKFGGNGYKVSGGLHGVGVSVVNALSEKLEATVKREGKVFYQSYKRGVPDEDVKVIGDSDITGTTVRFYPDPEIFETTVFDYDTLRLRFREMAFLNKGIEIQIKDERGEKDIKHTYCYEGGIKSFVEHLNKNKIALMPETVYMSWTDEVYSVEVAMQYNDSYNENIHSFANNINTHEGGSHETGFRSALTKVINAYALKNNFIKNADEYLSGEDIREGLVAIISVKLPEPQFEGQTKTKLGNSIMRTQTESVVTKGLNEYLEENPKSAKLILDKCLMAKRAREAARKARDMTRKKSGVFSMPDKLAEATSKDPKEREIFIVEGDSAGGSAKKGRDRRTQAILPLRGKILNVEKTRYDKALGNKEIKAMITVFGTGIGEDFDITKLRYDKIIIMTDADVDGSHIRTLLLTFFYRYMRPIVEEGHVYIAQPPLFKIAHGKTVKYVYSDQELRDYLNEIGDIKYDVQRYKGLGEMNFDQLRDTTMDKNARTLLKVTTENAIEADEIFTILMGEEVEPRREFIEQNSKLVADLDI